MTDWKKLYQEKLTTAEEAVKCIRSGDWIDYGWTTGHPVALDEALAARLPELEDLKIRGAIALWEPAVFKVPEAEKHMCWNSWHMSGIERKAAGRGLAFYAPLRYSELPRYYRENIAHPDVAMIQVSPMDQHGYFNFGPNASHLAAMCETAGRVIVEVNRNMPRCLGGSETEIHITQVDAVVEGNNPPIGQPNAIGKMIAESDLKDLGVHTEMYVDAFVDMALAGKITCSRKTIDRGRQVYAFGAGTQKMYDYMDNNPALMSAPVNYTNDDRVISQIDNFISINNAVSLDLFGQVASESAGIRHISGAGGQLDFVLGAYLSKGGKSFICCSSTFSDKNGELHSRILPTLENGTIVTDTRPNVMYVVTEYGCVNLKGLSVWERAEALISLAHPKFREELIRSAEAMHIWRRSAR